MCGIVGVCSVEPQSDISWLKRARDEMVHRGPDAYGEFWSSDYKVGLGHRRLSVVDLTSVADQPMQLLEAGLAIVFNGEIYNYRELRLELEEKGFKFRSNSDTEVLLAAYAKWGESFVTRVIGMFALAIYDSKNGLVFLARDRAGEKPLFYHLADGVFQFSSELKALMQNPRNSRQLDFEALDLYLALGYVPGDRCILKGFKKLPPAHLLRFELNTGRLKVSRYWEPPELFANQNVYEEDALLNELEALLENAVCTQMVADVSVGVLLSGGVDSSLVTAMAVRASSNVQTFTIGFPGHNQLDETTHARLIARHFGTQHTELMAEDSTADLMPSLARQFDEPVADSSMLPTFLVSKLVRQHCTVALGGDGADELFGGYPHYSRMLYMQHMVRYFPSLFRQVIAVSAEKILPIGFTGRNWAQSFGADFEDGLPFPNLLFDFKTRQNLIKHHINLPRSAESICTQLIPIERDLVQRATRMDFSNYLAEDILVKVDRSSMLSSMEMRAPFLDHRLIEFAFGRVPSNLKATTKEKKILLKRLACRILPREFDAKRKQGFSIPLGEWLTRGRFANLFNDVLRDPGCSFDPAIINMLFNGQAAGRKNSERLFALLLFELWRREYNVSF